MSLLCYTYDADHHCVTCTLEYAHTIPVKDWLGDPMQVSHNGILNLKDAIDLELIPDYEGNPIHVMLDTEEWFSNDIYEGRKKAVLSCGTCGGIIEERRLD